MGWDDVMHELFLFFFFFIVVNRLCMHKSNIMIASFQEQSSSINRSLGLGVTQGK